MTVEQMNTVRSFIRHLVSAVSGSTLYSPEHRQVLRLTEDAFANLQKAFAEHDEMTLVVIDDELVFNKTPLEKSMYADKFIRALTARGIGHLRITRAVEFHEVRSLILGLAGYCTAGEHIGSSQNIRLGKLDIHASSVDRGEDAVDEVIDGLELSEIPAYERETFMEIRESVRENRKIGMGGINRVVRSCIHAFRQVSCSLRVLAPLRALDAYAFTHSTNVCILNLSQAMALGIDGHLLHEIGVAGLLHDIGKLFVPADVLAKPGRLSAVEKDLIKQHPVRGAYYLLEMPGVPKLAVVCSYEHHMKFDGTGYPVARQGWKQNMCSQITAISDYFDALRTKRVYRDAMDATTVGALVADNAGIHFHPVLARNFLHILGNLHDDMTPGERQDPADDAGPPRNPSRTS
jgi:HD-GYP domain-containing protein (c-di-GMP phosphodiesterase class II)